MYCQSYFLHQLAQDRPATILFTLPLPKLPSNRLAYKRLILQINGLAHPLNYLPLGLE